MNRTLEVTFSCLFYSKVAVQMTIERRQFLYYYYY